MTRPFRRCATVVLIGMLGCGSRGGAVKAPARPFQGMKLTVAAVGEPAILPTLDAQRGEWEERHGAEVAIAREPFEPASSAGGADVLVFPGDRLGDLVDRKLLAVIPEEAIRPKVVADEESDADTPETKAVADPLQFADVLPAFRDQVTKYGMDRYAFPYGGSALVLVYRRDAFARESNRKAAAEANVALEPPRTWDALDALAKFLHGRDWDGDGRTDEGIALVTGADPERVGLGTFFARSAALGQHPDQFSFVFDDDTMEPSIAGPPFVEAWSSLRALAASGPKAADAEAARAAFREGKVALLIDRAERYGRWNDPKKPVPTGVAALPGSTKVFDPDRKAFEAANPPNRPSYLPRGGGWLVGISASCTGPKLEAALDFLKYLTGPEASTRILTDRAFPMLPTRMTQLGTGLADPRVAPGVDPQAWQKAVAESLTAERVIPGLRIPEAGGYLDDLRFDHGDAAGRSPAEALAEARRLWAERTKRLGVQRQLWHYRHSLNRRATSDDPPPR